MAANPLDQIDPKYMVPTKGGKLHPTYPGVLAAAYANGLVGLEAKVEQFPSEANGWTAVCSAVATFRGEDGRDRIYAEIGDADPHNTTPHIAPHKIRMAATRAKGRALRDALGIGVALKEEIDGTDEETPHNARQGASTGKPPARVAAAPRADRTRSAVDPPAGPVRQAAGPVVDDEAKAPYCCFKCGVEVPERNALRSLDLTGCVFCPEHGRAHMEQRALVDQANLPAAAVAA